MDMKSDKELLRETYDLLTKMRDAHDRALTGWQEAINLAQKYALEVARLEKEVEILKAGSKN
jgi:hypothetical protein